MAEDCAWLLAGTRVMTLRGEVPVETVHTGDRVVTLSGEGSTLKPVAGVRRIDVDLEAHPSPPLAAPVRVLAGAVAAGMPIRDLLLGPGTALALDDDDGARVLVPAHRLANGASIRSEPARGRVTYWMVELAAHDILMTDGMASESGVAAGPVVPLRQAAAPVDDLRRRREGATCVPLLQGAAAAALHARLLAQAEADGFALTEEPGFEIMLDGAALPPLLAIAGLHTVLLPPGTTLVELRSRSVVPGELDPAGGDMRRVGVPIARMVLDGDELDLDGLAPDAGFLPTERNGAARWRWTDGAARLALAPRGVEAMLEIEYRPAWTRYWIRSGPPGAVREQQRIDP